MYEVILKRFDDPVWRFVKDLRSFGILDGLEFCPPLSALGGKKS